jgi:hypothetical protein
MQVISPVPGMVWGRRAAWQGGERPKKLRAGGLMLLPGLVETRSRG